MPRTKRPAGTTVDRRNGRRNDLRVVAGGRLAPPDGLTSEALVLWSAYWDDPVSGVQTGVDRGLLNRWIREYDRYLRTVDEADGHPIVTGSKGQQVENPLYRVAYRALDAAERCERQLGIGPLWRSNLGIAVLTQQRSLADMNTRYGGANVTDDGTAQAEAHEDPRIIQA
jgi:P27 family predicted phage terminase small subunit